MTTDRAGNPDRAYSFNGTGNYIKVKDSPSLDITDEITITAWRYITTNSLGRLVRKINTWGFPVGGYILSAAGDYMNSELQLATHPNAVVITRIERTFPLNTWGFAAMTYDGNEVSLFFNGEKIFSEPATGKININNVDLLIGASEGVEYFGGKIDEIRIYDRALTENEILSLYSGQ